MPYIRKHERYRLDGDIEALAGNIRQQSQGKPAGFANYAITTLLLRIWEPSSYTQYNEIMGVLACVQAEMYRKRIAPYENEKAKANGEVY